MNKSNSLLPDHSSNSQPYAIAAVFPGRQPKTIGRTRYRADADEMVRFLQQKLPKATFYVTFDLQQRGETPIG